MGGDGISDRRSALHPVVTQESPPSIRLPCQSPGPRVLPCGRAGDRSSRRERCRSSVVEHSLGKGEVVGSIPTGSTTFRKCRRPLSCCRGPPSFELIGGAGEAAAVA